MRKKWYLNTWAICIFFLPTIISFVFPILFIFPIAGIAFAILQYNYDKKLFEKYGSIDELDNKIHSLDEEYTKKEKDLKNNYEEKYRVLEIDYTKRNNDLEELYKIKQNELEVQYTNLLEKYNTLKDEYKMLSTDVIIEHYNLSDYDTLTSEECKNKIALLKLEEKNLIKSDEAVIIYSQENKNIVNNNLKQILRCFNTECDNVLVNLSVKNIDAMRNKVSKSFESINKIFAVDGLELSNKLLTLKLEELNLVYTYELKRQQEIEIQKEIKAQMIEEEKVHREIEQEKKKIEKDQSQFTNEISKLLKYVQKTSNDIEKQLYIDKINELEGKLKELEQVKENVLEREANAKAGFVYIISNIGSFGANIYKIGMTRRLKPMDRIKELSSASVPFEFDVHAMIFSADAPALESKLHQHFQKQSVNKVNPRKEFFNVSLEEIEQVVKDNFNNTVEFTYVPIAREYRQSIVLDK